MQENLIILQTQAESIDHEKAGRKLMEITTDEISGLVDRPSEGLNREVKAWIDPATPAGIEKIVKACFALRNRNGGFLLVGFDDATLLPDTTNVPAGVRAAFHVDVIQGIISKYASQPFEIAVGFGSRNGCEFPVIKVADGVRSPVAVKSALSNGSGGYLLRDGDVYFRTLGSNGTPSSARALPKDWPDIIEVCFENREADIGRFFRRHLSGKEVSTLIEALSQMVGPASPPPPSLRDRTHALLIEGEQRYQTAIETRSLTADEQKTLQSAMWQVAVVADPARPASIPDRNFLNTALGSNPQLTGWPAWLDSRSFTDRSAAPQVIDKGWQALIVSLGEVWSPHLDFMRLDPKGEFYLQRILQDDVTDKVAPGKALDVILVLLRVGEVIAVALSMAKALGWNDNARLGISFLWTKLAGRELASWANPFAMISPGYVCHDNQAETHIELPANTPVSAIAPYVEEATRELLVIFDGYSLPRQPIEDWTQKLVERRL